MGPWTWGTWRSEKVRVLGGTCVLVMGLHRHVHGVVIAGNGPHHSCDTRDMSLAVLLLPRYRGDGWLLWLASCMVNQWGGVASGGRGEHSVRTYTHMSSYCAPSSCPDHPSPLVVPREMVGEWKEGAATSGLFKHFVQTQPLPTLH